MRTTKKPSAAMSSAPRITNGVAGVTSVSLSRKTDLLRDTAADWRARADGCGWLRDLLLISLRIFQLLEIVGIIDLENENPTLPIRFAVDYTRVGFERFVHVDNCALHRRVDDTGGFDRFDNRNRFFCVRLPIHFRQFHINPIGQFRLRVVGDADAYLVPFALNPFVTLGVKQIVWDVHGYFL